MEKKRLDKKKNKKTRIKIFKKEFFLKQMTIIISAAMRFSISL